MILFQLAQLLPPACGSRRHRVLASMPAPTKLMAKRALVSFSNQQAGFSFSCQQAVQWVSLMQGLFGTCLERGMAQTAGRAPADAIVLNIFVGMGLG